MLEWADSSVLFNIHSSQILLTGAIQNSVITPTSSKLRYIWKIVRPTSEEDASNLEKVDGTWLGLFIPFSVWSSGNGVKSMCD
jgi:hypothetical protein